MDALKDLGSPQSREIPRYKTVSCDSELYTYSTSSLLIGKILAYFPLVDILGQTNRKLCCS